MKKALISMVILIAFSMLTMSVSAPIPDYYAARFYGYATESCRIYDEYPGEGVWPIALGKGTFRISGLAIVTEDTDYYWAHRTENPNTCIWTHRTSIKVS